MCSTVGIRLTTLRLPETSSYRIFTSPVIKWWTRHLWFETIQLPDFLSVIQVTIQLDIYEPIDHSVTGLFVR